MNSLRRNLDDKLGPISGAFRSRHQSRCETRNGRPFTKLYLEDISGRVPAYIWDENLSEHSGLRDLSCVVVQGHVRKRKDGPVVDLRKVELLEQRAGEVVRLIPQSLCPQPYLLSFLQVAVERLTLEPLVQFVHQVLSDDSIAFSYVSVPASLNHHHSQPGGLLQHSIECFQMVNRYKEFSKEETALGLVAALFHDIGKILTMTHDMQRTSLGHQLEHDKLTLEILAPYLKNLDVKWPEGGRQLRYLLTYKLDSQIPKVSIADVVACSDRMSTALNILKYQSKELLS